MPRIAALTTCVNYSDFLSYFLLFNRSVFDRLLVITTPEDQDTQNLCKYYHVECLVTDVFYENNQVFGKSQAINQGIKHLLDTGENEYLCHMDSDIVLPPRTGDFIRANLENKDCIYTIDRMRVVGFENWVAFLSKPDLVYEEEVWLRCDRFPVMPRIFKEKAIVPIGYFQLWHSDYAKDEYPNIHENAARSDMLFALKWPRNKRKLIPIAVGFHLESESANLGTNWNGRKTKQFKLEVKPQEIIPEEIPEIKAESTLQSAPQSRLSPQTRVFDWLQRLWYNFGYFLNAYRIW